MGIVSVEQTDGLYWLGRYTERVYTTVRLFLKTYDTMIDKLEDEYQDFCARLEIPDIYESGEHFIKSYAFDEHNPDSIMSNLLRAYDNAVVLREEIGSDALSYVQLAIYDIQKAAVSEAPMIEFQKIIDNILAFWGIVDDIIPSENIRNTIKIGKRIERIDLFARLRSTKSNLMREVKRLTGRIDRCNLRYKKYVLEELNELVLSDNLDYKKITDDIEHILE